MGKEDYIMAKISDEMYYKAIHFLFPELSKGSEAYRSIKSFIKEEFDRIQTAVLYYRNERFVELINKYGLDVGTKEVIVISNAVRATDKYSVEPHLIYQK